MTSLKEYEEMSKSECHFCGGALGSIEFWGPHSGGWKVWGFKEKQWLYRTCLKCKYQWALWKLGVPR